MPSTFLTKSAFKIGCDCPTKLYYYRADYPSGMEEDEYIQFLAEGGHMVGKLAQLLYPGGILIETEGDQEAAVKWTEEELKKKKVVLFEAAFKAGNKLVRVDVLEKSGNSVKLIEVKSKAFDSEEDRELRNKKRARTLFINTKGEIEPGWKDYLEDICFQEYVARLSHPEFSFIPYLLLPDKARRTSIDNLSSMFSLQEVPLSDGKRTRRQVHFHGDEKKVREDTFLSLINVEEELSILRADVEKTAKKLEALLSPLKKAKTAPSTNCRGCEYDVEGKKSGYLECLGKLAKPKPHLFDLYFGTAIQGGDLFDSLLKQGKASLFDVPMSSLTKKRGQRQRVQIEYSKANKEWFSADLPSIIEAAKYPLHFIDFETSRVAIPYHAGMRPYEQVAFQWSCHTISAPGEEPTHSEWINTENTFPNFLFARSLRKAIGNKGTVLTWAHHESTTLNDIAKQMDEYGEKDEGLKKWMRSLTDKNHGRILVLS